MDRSSERLAVLALLVTAVLWGTSFFVTKVAVEVVPPVVVTFWRSAIAALFLGAVVLVQASVNRRSRGEGAVASPRADLRRWRLRRPEPWLWWAIGCGVATGFALLTLSFGMEHIGSSPAGIIMSTVPAWTLLFAALAIRGEGRITLRQYAGLVLGMFAVIMLAWPGSEGWAPLGILAILFAAIGHAAANVTSQLSLRGNDAIAVAAVSMLVAAIITLPPAAGTLMAGAYELPLEAVAAIVVLGVLPSGVAFVLFFYAIAVLGSGRASFINFLLPPIAIVSGVIALGETPGITTLAALLLATAALALGLGGRGAGSEGDAVPGAEAHEPGAADDDAAADAVEAGDGSRAGIGRTGSPR